MKSILDNGRNIFSKYVARTTSNVRMIHAFYSCRKIAQNLAKLVGITLDPNNYQPLHRGNEFFPLKNEGGRKEKSNICLSLNHELLEEKKQKKRDYHLCKTYFSSAKHKILWTAHSCCVYGRWWRRGPWELLCHLFSRMKSSWWL